MITLSKHLKQAGAPSDLTSLIEVIVEAGKEIFEKVKYTHASYTSQKNAFGDTQLNLDLIADSILRKHLKGSNEVWGCTSEENSNIEKYLEQWKDNYFVAFDPIDGSSILEAGLAVGTTIGIYPGDLDIIGASGRDQVVALYMLYGPAMKFVYTTGEGTHVFTMDETGELILEEENVQLDPQGKICAEGNIGFAKTNSCYRDLINEFIDDEYKVRYSGSMTADVHEILKKKGGVYIYPTDKMRLLVECNPLAFIVEQSGGDASDGHVSILDITIKDLEQKSPFIIGSKKDVKIASRFLKNCI